MISALAASLGLEITQPAFWMPLLMMVLLLALILGGTLFDGFDIGVGVLLRTAPASERPAMMVGLSPWRDANEFWLLLALGLFLSAFPLAWGAMLAHLYVPLMVTIVGVVLRSVAFEFRIRAATELRAKWINRFWFGSVLTAFGHGMMLAAIATSYQKDAPSIWFGLFIGVCAVAGYALLGACWMVMRTRGVLQSLSVAWARHSIRWTAAGMAAIAIALGLSNPAIFYKWSSSTNLALASLVWVIMLGCFVSLDMILTRVTQPKYEMLSWMPFSFCLILFILMLGGLSYSMFPFVILDNLTLWDAAASINALQLVLAATIVAVPVMLVFNLLGYRRLFGKAVKV